MPSPNSRKLLLFARSGLTYLLRDDFNTDQAAPLSSPRSAEPGPGTLTGSGDKSTTSIVAGVLTIAAGSSSGSDFAPGNIARVAGRTIVGIYASTATRTRFDFDATNRIEIGQLVTFDNQAIGGPYFVFSTTYKFAYVARGTGHFLFVKGGVYTNWTLYYLSAAGTGVLVPKIGQVTTAGAGTWGNFRVLDLPAPFSSDYGLATQRLAGARTGGDTFTHEANCILEFVVTTLSSVASITFDFRKQDASNYWTVSIDNVGTISLTETVAAVPTVRGTAATVVANGHRVVVVADGTTIRVYSNNVLRITYSSASNFATATSGILSILGTGGAVSDIVSWPRVLGSSAAALLDAAIA